jgi:hypothetical protein
MPLLTQLVIIAVSAAGGAFAVLVSKWGKR